MNVELNLTTPEASRIHANVFRMISGLFLAEPSQELLDQLALDETWEIISMFVAPSGYRPLRDLALNRQFGISDLRLAFHSLFTVPLGAYVFPFESCYRVATPPGPLMGPPAIEVQSAYAAAGFAVSPELSEPPDHVGLELAFVAELMDRQATAQDLADHETGSLVAAQIHSFCRDHLNCWLPALRNRIGDNGPSAFYAAVGTLAAELVEGTVKSPMALSD
jgi:TorA maturation chaperone TorD